MAHISDLFNRQEQPPAPPVAEGAPQEAPINPDQMRGLQQIVGTVDQFMPAIEKITGLQRKDIFLQLLKSGFRGNWSSFLQGLMGQPAEKPSKFEKYVKTVVIWGLVAVFLGGIAIVSLIGYAKLISYLLGGL